MTMHSSAAERLERAVDAVLDGQPSASIAVDAALRPLVEAASVLRSALTPPPVSAGFEARLGARLAEAGSLRRRMRTLRGPGRLLITGAAVGSAAVGVGVTAYAVWRGGRRAHWLGHR